MIRAQRPKTIEEYAALQVALLDGSREEVLQGLGLDEDLLSEIDTEFQDALSSAMDDDSEDGAIPPLLQAYDEGLRRARSRALAARPREEVLTLADFAVLTRALESGKDIAQAFSSRGTTFEKYLRASEYWTPKLAEDPELTRVFMTTRRR